MKDFRLIEDGWRASRGSEGKYFRIIEDGRTASQISEEKDFRMIEDSQVQVVSRRSSTKLFGPVLSEPNHMEFMIYFGGTCVQVAHPMFTSNFSPWLKRLRLETYHHTNTHFHTIVKNVWNCNTTPLHFFGMLHKTFCLFH